VRGANVGDVNRVRFVSDDGAWWYRWRGHSSYQRTTKEEERSGVAWRRWRRDAAGGKGVVLGTIAEVMKISMDIKIICIWQKALLSGGDLKA